MTVRYVVLRSGGGGTLVTGATAPPWETIGSALFYSLAEAQEFAAKLDHGTVFRLARVAATGADSA